MTSFGGMRPTPRTDGSKGVVLVWVGGGGGGMVSAEEHKEDPAVTVVNVGMKDDISGPK